MPGYDDLVEYFQVRYQVYGTTDDGIDADDLPDKTEINGWITFTPNLRKGRGILFQTATPPFELIPLRRRVRVTSGTLSHNDTGYVKLEAASPNGNPTGWNWKVTFDLTTPTGKLELAPFDIAADPNSIVDLTTAAPVGGSSGTSIVRGMTGTSVGEVTLVNGDTFEFYGDDVEHTLLGSVVVPALTVYESTLTAASLAVTAAESADADASDASAAKIAAESARDTAIGARDTAISARDTATSAASSASDSATTAGTARTGAESARDTAVTANANAQSAKTAAEGARDTAVTANTNAQSAKTAAETARDQAVSAKTAAEAARDQAIAGVVPDNAVSTIKIQDGAVTKAKTASAVQTSLDKADSAYQKPGAGIPKADLASAVQTSLDKADAAAPANALVADFVWVAQSGTRKTGIGDLAAPQYIGRALIIQEITYQFDTADASGSTTVAIQKNGVNVVGSSQAITAANQVDGTATDAARTFTLTDSSRQFAKGDRFALNVSAIGTTPGKGVRVWIRGVWV